MHNTFIRTIHTKMQIYQSVIMVISNIKVIYLDEHINMYDVIYSNHHTQKSHALCLKGNEKKNTIIFSIDFVLSFLMPLGS